MTRAFAIRATEIIVMMTKGRAMPLIAARAATPSGLSRFASSCQHRIAIAANDAPYVALVLFCTLYFSLQLIRGWAS